MKRKVFLHGRLKETFGDVFEFDIETAIEAFRALKSAFPNFLKEIEQGSYQIVRGDLDDGMSLDIDLASSMRLGNADLHIIPVAEGGKNSSGNTKIILGVALVGAALFFSGGFAGLASPIAAGSSFSGLGVGLTYGNMAVLGLGLAAAGISSNLAKQTKSTSESDKSSLLGGLQNNNEQGNPIILIFGEAIVTPQPVSFGMDIENTGLA